MTGSDANSGTSQAQPWATFQAIIVNSDNSVFGPGDQILFQANVVHQVGYFRFGSSGTAANPIVIGMYGSGALPVLNCTDAVTGNACVSFFSCANVTVQDLDIRGRITNNTSILPYGSKSYAGIWINPNSALNGNNMLLQRLMVSLFPTQILVSFNTATSNVAIRSVTALNGPTAGIIMDDKAPVASTTPFYSGFQVEISDCTITDIAGTQGLGESAIGIQVRRAKGIKIVRNFVSRLGGGADFFSMGGIEVSYASNALIEQNAISNVLNGNATVPNVKGPGIVLGGGTVQALVQRNYVTLVDGQGIFASEPTSNVPPHDGNVIRFNIVQNAAFRVNDAGGISIAGAATNLTIHSNVVYAGQVGKANAVSKVFFVDNSAFNPTNLLCFNNIFMAGPSTQTLFSSSTLLTGTTWSTNVWYAVNTTALQFQQVTPAVSSTTLASWNVANTDVQTNPGLSAPGFESIPSSVAALNSFTAYSPSSSNSYVVGRGVALASLAGLVDFVGTPLVQPYTIGAYQASFPSPTTSPFSSGTTCPTFTVCTCSSVSCVVQGNLTVPSGATIVATSVPLVVQGSLTVQPGATIIVSSSSSLQVAGQTTVNGGTLVVQTATPGTFIVVTSSGSVSGVGFSSVSANSTDSCVAIDSATPVYTSSTISVVVQTSAKCTSGLSSGAIVGIVLGSVAAATLVIILIIVLYRRHELKKVDETIRMTQQSASI